MNTRKTTRQAMPRQAPAVKNLQQAVESDEPTASSKSVLLHLTTPPTKRASKRKFRRVRVDLIYNSHNRVWEAQIKGMPFLFALSRKQMWALISGWFQTNFIDYGMSDDVGVEVQARVVKTGRIGEHRTYGRDPRRIKG